MNDILRLAKNYSKGRHIELLPLKKNNILNSLVFLYDEKWEGQGDKYPYEILTYLLDCYYVLPERPDLASLFCWQAINHSYYSELLGDLSRRCSDTNGIKKLCENLLNNKNKYSPMLQLYLNRLPIKVFHYVASYMLKGHAIDKADIDRRYRASSFDSVRKNIPVIEEILDQSYGKAFEQITNPIIVNNRAKLNIESKNQNKSRQITHSFALKLRELLLKQETYIT